MQWGEKWWYNVFQFIRYNVKYQIKRGGGWGVYSSLKLYKLYWQLESICWVVQGRISFATTSNDLLEACRIAGGAARQCGAESPSPPRRGIIPHPLMWASIIPPSQVTHLVIHTFLKKWREKLRKPRKNEKKWVVLFSPPSVPLELCVA